MSITEERIVDELLNNQWILLSQIVGSVRTLSFYVVYAKKQAILPQQIVGFFSKGTVGCKNSNNNAGQID